MKYLFPKLLLIACCGLLLFVPFLGQVHLFDWDEANFAECAREMLVSKNYLRVQIDFQPFWEKPPVFIWMQACCMKLFGINAFSARLPNALTGIVTLCAIFYAGCRVAGERTARWWVLLYLASWLPHFYFKTGIIDPLFNLFIFCSFFQVWLLQEGKKPALHALLSGMFLGLAVLTKGPAAILIAMLCFVGYLIWSRGLAGLKIKHLLLLTLSAFVTTACWFGADIVQNGWWFTREFITYQVRLFGTEDAGHGGPFYYHFLVLLIGCFPASAFLFQALGRGRATVTAVSERNFTRWMSLLFWLTLILFSIVKTKIVHYSSLCWFPLTFLAAQQLRHMAEEEGRAKRGFKFVLIIIGLLLGLAITLLPVVGLHIKELIPYVQDKFAAANMQANVRWSYIECMYGAVYLLGFLVAVVIMRRSFRRGVLVLVLVQVAIIQVAAYHFTPKIEAYSQAAAIDFYKQFDGRDVYLKPLGFKSYAYLFYAKSMPGKQEAYYTKGTDWLLHGRIDKPAYFISKNINEEQILKDYPMLQKTGEKNGYIFWKRSR